MDNIYYTYLYRDRTGIPMYVGKGKGKRAWQHLKVRKKMNLFTNTVQKMIREGHNPQPEFICKDVDEELALFVEEEAIAKYGRKDLGTGPLFNLTNGGEGAKACRNTGFPKGTKLSEEWKRNIGLANKGKGVGRKLSDETKLKQSKSHLGKVFSDEHLANMRLARLNREFRPWPEIRRKRFEERKLQNQDKQITKL